MHIFSMSVTYAKFPSKAMGGVDYTAFLSTKICVGQADRGKNNAP